MIHLDELITKHVIIFQKTLTYLILTHNKRVLNKEITKTLNFNCCHRLDLLQNGNIHNSF